jgi:hypothetical protein
MVRSGNREIIQLGIDSWFPALGPFQFDLEHVKIIFEFGESTS